MPSASALSRSWTVISASASVPVRQYLRVSIRASVFSVGVLAENELQGAPMHVEAARRLRDVAIALLEDALDMLPAHAVGRHRVAGRRRQLAAVRGQRLLD